jgi:hypothetical protein
MNIQQTNTGDQLAIKAESAKHQATCMELVREHIRRQRYSSASLVKKLNLYSSSHVNNCLKKLKDAGMIGAVWDSSKVSYVYYNIKL